MFGTILQKLLLELLKGKFNIKCFRCMSISFTNLYTFRTILRLLQVYFKYLTRILITQSWYIYIYIKMLCLNYVINFFILNSDVSHIKDKNNKQNYFITKSCEQAWLFFRHIHNQELGIFLNIG